MNFTFEHESSLIPIALTIKVEYTAYYREADYENPAEFDFEHTYQLFCGDLDMTACIDKSNYTKLQDEIESAINDAVTENFFNQ